jgi:tRNA pseudouridine55 synthase
MLWTDPIVLRLHKPQGISSFDIVKKLKRVLPKEVKKIGYFGTLDPFAEGLLLVALNQANRLTQFVHQDLTKTYVAVGVLGVETKTQDLTEEIYQKDESDYFKNVISKFGMEFYQEQLKYFLGRYLQAPPVYSAAKFEGKKLCDWMRNDGVEIKKEQVERYIYDLQFRQLNFPEVVFEVECSSGTYIRTLFVDMANKMGTLGTLKNLLRKKIGSIENSTNCVVDSLLDSPQNFVVPLKELLPYPVLVFNEQQIMDFIHGKKWHVENLADTSRGIYWVTNQDGKIYGLAQQSENISKVLVGLH